MAEASPLREGRAAEGHGVRGADAGERSRARGADAAGRGWLASIGDALVSVFFPAGCRICDELLTSATRTACRFAERAWRHLFPCRNLLARFAGGLYRRL